MLYHILILSLIAVANAAPVENENADVPLPAIEKVEIVETKVVETFAAVPVAAETTMAALVEPAPAASVESAESAESHEVLAAEEPKAELKNSDAVVADNAAESAESLEMTTMMPELLTTTLMPVWWNRWMMNPARNYSGNYIADMNAIGNIFSMPERTPKVPEASLIANDKAAMIYYKLEHACVIMKKFAFKCAEICFYHNYCE